MKRVLIIWPHNEYCIDALLFYENFHSHYIEERRRTFSYALHWREKEKCTNKGTDKQYIVGCCCVCIKHPANRKGYMETGTQLKVSSDRLVKPGIEPGTPGLQCRRFIHYSTAAPIHSCFFHTQCNLSYLIVVQNSRSSTY